VFGAMTTALYKPVRRRTRELRRDGGKLRAVIVTLYPAGHIGLRLHGTRREETIPIQAVYERAVKMRLALEQAEKRTRRAMRKRGRSPC
jgi:hypothetical protein